MPSVDPSYGRAVEECVGALHRPAFQEYWDGEYHEDEWGARNTIVQDFAFLFALQYERTGDEEYRDLAREYLLEEDRTSHFGSILYGSAYELLEDELTPAERERFGTDWVEGAKGAVENRVAGGAPVEEWENVSNHAACAAFFADYARHHFPEVDEERGSGDLADDVWDVWWTRREFQEQASNYEGFTEAILAHWTEIRGRSDDLYASPSVRNMFERKLRVVTPGGLVAPYGDSTPLQLHCQWIALFEKVASGFDDGRFRDAARDVFLHMRDEFLHQVDDSLVESSIGNLFADRLAFKNHLHEVAWLGLAALWHDESVSREPRPVPAGRIQRLPYGYDVDGGLGEADLYDVLEDGQVALAGGPGDGTYVLLSVGPERVHDHADAGAIQLLSRDGAVLLGTNGYLQRELLYHHAFYAQPTDWDRYPADDPDRIQSGDGDCSARIESLDIDGTGAGCALTFDEYHGLPLSLRRAVEVDEDVVTVRDRTTATEEGYSGGPLYHAESVDRIDDSTLRLRNERLRSMGGLECENRPGDLLLSVEGPKDAEVDVVQPDLPPIYDESYQDFPTTKYKQLWKECYRGRNCVTIARPLDPGEEVTFVTRLRFEG